MATDAFPQTDTDLIAWSNTFIAYLTANGGALGIGGNESGVLVQKFNAFTTAYNAQVAATNAAKAATVTKNAAQDVYETSLRTIIGIIQANPNVTNQQRESLGITVRKTRTVIPAPTTRPGIISITGTGSRTLEIAFGDVMGNEVRRGRPGGATGCQIYALVGTIPASPEDCAFVDIDTRSPYEMTFDADEAGKTAYIYLRWFNAKGEVGPWSQMGQGTVPA